MAMRGDAVAQLQPGLPSPYVTPDESPRKEVQESALRLRLQLAH